MAHQDRVRRVQDLRRSNASQPIPSGRVYRRKPKHRDRPDARREPRDTPPETRGV